MGCTNSTSNDPVAKPQDQPSSPPPPPGVTTAGVTTDNGRHTSPDLATKNWYHGGISPDMAESRLREGQQGTTATDGSYLVYDHPNEPGSYVLLVLYKNRVLRWKISRISTGITYKLGDGGKEYPSVKELIKAHRGLTGTPIQLEGGELVVLSKVYVLKDKNDSKSNTGGRGGPLEEEQGQGQTEDKEQKQEVPSGDLNNKAWYHGGISTAEEAERRLRDRQQGSSPTDGSYLVYDHPNESGSYVLLVLYKNRVLRWKISRNSTVTYKLGDGGKEYPSVKELIKTHRGLTGTPIQLEGGELVLLSKVYVLKDKNDNQSNTGVSGGPLEEEQETEERGQEREENEEVELPSEDLSDKTWYHGGISLEDATARLLKGSGNIDGSYLVYDKPGEHGRYILLFYYNGTVLPKTIYRDGSTGMYMFEGSTTGKRSVKELIKAHRGRNGEPLPFDNKDASIILSKSYVPR